MLFSMFFGIFAAVSSFIIFLISSLGFFGIFLAMTIESACIPLPSEIIMPFSGYLVSQLRFGLWQVALAGALGNVAGSVIAYAVGRYGGREIVLKYGKYFLISHHDVKIADRWFARYGQAVVFFTRLLPAIRTFISLPAGIARMPFKKFVLFTFFGSYLWCYGLAWIGMKLGENWESVGGYFHKFDFAIGLSLLALASLWIIRHVYQPQDE
jgi:membrane protein DedA with SNARE-associated domain